MFAKDERISCNLVCEVIESGIFSFESVIQLKMKDAYESEMHC